MLYIALGGALLVGYLWLTRGKAPLLKRREWRVVTAALALAAFTGAVFVGVRGSWGTAIVLVVVGLWLAASARKTTPIAPPPPAAPMSEAEARRIFGVGVEAGREEVQAAYTRLMRAGHPDKGGAAAGRHDHAGLLLGLERLAGVARLALGHAGEPGAVLAAVFFGDAAGVVELLSEPLLDQGELLARVGAAGEAADLDGPAPGGLPLALAVQLPDVLGLDDLNLRGPRRRRRGGEGDLEARLGAPLLHGGP